MKVLTRYLQKASDSIESVHIRISMDTHVLLSDADLTRIEAINGMLSDIRNAQIYALYLSGVKQKDIAIKFKISPARVCQIISEKKGKK